MEKWKSIQESNKYYISNSGRVKSLVKGEKILKTPLDIDGYRKIILRINGKTFYFRICRLVAIAFVDNPNNLPIVNHKDGIKTNDFDFNIEWSSVRENTCHSLKDRKKLPIGVSKRKDRNKYRSRIYINKKFIHLGDFNTAEEASDAYIQALNHHKIVNNYAK